MAENCDNIDFQKGSKDPSKDPGIGLGRQKDKGGGSKGKKEKEEEATVSATLDGIRTRKVCERERVRERGERER